MNIFIAKNGTRQGPYPVEHLKELICRGEISLSDKAWHEGCQEWTSIKDMPDLLCVILPPPPPEQPDRPVARSADTNTRCASISTIKPISEQRPRVSNTVPSPPGFWPNNDTKLKDWFVIVGVGCLVCGLFLLFVFTGNWAAALGEIMIIATLALLIWGWGILKQKHSRKAGLIIFVCSSSLVVLLLGMLFVMWGDPFMTKKGGYLGFALLLSAGGRAMGRGWSLMKS